MIRRLVFAMVIGTFGLALAGCGEADKPVNPNNLEYSKDGPPPRGGPPSEAKGGAGKKAK